jgi:hypothetical protein
MEDPEKTVMFAARIATFFATSAFGVLCISLDSAIASTVPEDGLDVSQFLSEAPHGWAEMLKQSDKLRIEVGEISPLPSGEVLRRTVTVLSNDASHLQHEIRMDTGAKRVEFVTAVNSKYGFKLQRSGVGDWLVTFRGSPKAP